MVLKRLQNIIIKEWQVLFTDLNSALMITILPLLIVGQGVLYIWLAFRFGGEEMLTTGLFRNAVENFSNVTPQIQHLTEKEQLIVFLLHQFNFFLLLIPIMVAVSVSTFSIVEEKTTGSLEALLATPVHTWELLLGKALSGAIPALIVTWYSAGVYLLAINALGWGHLIGHVTTVTWYLTLFLMTPAVTMLSFMLGVIGSAKAKDAKSAQNLVIVIILPILALIAVQVTGVIWFTPILTAVLALVIVFVDIIVLRIAVNLFHRESILTEWH